MVKNCLKTKRNFLKFLYENHLEKIVKMREKSDKNFTEVIVAFQAIFNFCTAN